MTEQNVALMNLNGAIDINFLPFAAFLAPLKGSPAGAVRHVGPTEKQAKKTEPEGSVSLPRPTDQASFL
ncbi:hypothetical protein [Pseudomonas chlororaphis]|uniref:hypothetical protein n=1 Tax=Pseudomonas chlororaphis TaxID=587753 RepID=UPI0011DD0639|nr:hypothetical protein [Pseudomonas chlororaphis]